MCEMTVLNIHKCGDESVSITPVVSLRSVFRQSVYAHIHPDTLKEMNLSIGDFVKIGVCTLECWPDTTLGLDQVALNSVDTSTGSAITKIEIIKNPLIANKIVYRCDDEIQKSYLPMVLQNKIVFIGQEVTLPYFSKTVTIIIKKAESVGSGDLTEMANNLSIETTYYKIVSPTVFEVFCEVEKVNLPPLIGADSLQAEIEGIIVKSLDNPQSFGIMGPPNTLFIAGSSGTGKSLLAQTILQKSKFPHTTLRPKKTLEHSSEYRLILLDGLDIVKDDDDDLQLKLEEFLQTIPANAFILATGSYLTTKLKKYFPIQRQMPATTSAMRQAIMLSLLKGLDLGDSSVTEREACEIAAKAHGYVGADIRNVARQALLMSNDGVITARILKQALTKVPPRAMKDVKVEVPEVKWSEIGGMKDTQRILEQVVTWPLTHSDKFARMGITPPHGVLLYGPPGCCKTMMAKALATESGLNFLSVKGPELFSMYVGESERAVRELFNKARVAAPAIIFFDEIDALATHRGTEKGSGVSDRVLAQLLTELDGVEGLTGVVVVAATNRPDRIDKALLRPGRFEKIVYIPLPDYDSRKEIFSIRCGRMPTEHVDYAKLAQLTEGHSGAEVVGICQQAAMASLESEVVTMGTFEEVIKSNPPRTTHDTVKFYQDFSLSS